MIGTTTVFWAQQENMRKILYTLPLLGLAILLLIQLKTSIFVTESARLSRDELPATILWGDADQMAWMMNANEYLNDAPSRVRHIMWDSYPEGRDVHWSSIITLGLQFGAKAVQKLTKEPNMQAMETAAPIVYTAIYIVCLTALCIFLTRQFGINIGYLAFFSIILTSNIWKAWHPYWLDHHGMEYYSFAAILLGIIAMWHKNTTTSAVITGIATGVALWIGTLSNLPILLMVLFSALAAMIFSWYNKLPAGIAPKTWLIWGIAAASTSLFGYIFEYHDYWTLRLEINNPVYSLSLLAGAGIFAIISNYTSTRNLPPAHIALVAILGVVLCGPLLLLLQTNSVSGETFSRLIAVTGEGTRMNAERLGLVIILPVLAAFALRTYRPVPTVITIPLISAILLYIYTCFYIRVLPYCEIACIASGIAILLSTTGKLSHATMALVLCIVILGATESISYVKYEKNFGRLAVAPYVEVAKTSKGAAKLIVEDAKKRGVSIHLIANLNYATPLAYFTGGTVRGAIYWEAINGITDTNNILANKDLSELPALLHSKGITYVVLNPGDVASTAYLKFGLSGYDIATELSTQQILNNTPPWLEKISPPNSKLSIYYVKP